jgi:hypothetical protein
VPAKIKKLLTRLTRWWSYHRITDALALNNRGEVRGDGLSLKHFHNRLEIEWQARDVHPWERDLPESRLTELFVEQCLDDTSAAIERLFCDLPEVEFIDFRVIDADSSAPIIYGSVGRSEAEALGQVSPGMKLKKLGATYRISNWRFEPLS